MKDKDHTCHNKRMQCKSDEECEPLPSGPDIKGERNHARQTAADQGCEYNGADIQHHASLTL
ncbi:hypothetical protein [Rossellomorea marisflavi]|uniref:hypothetical protein n=1 Tax=Rossellomorea marisflavi TaxID=189381 RepID=UPI003D2F2505